jgi:hypothetical protein
MGAVIIRFRWIVVSCDGNEATAVLHDDRADDDADLDHSLHAPDNSSIPSHCRTRMTRGTTGTATSRMIARSWVLPEDRMWTFSSVTSSTIRSPTATVPRSQSRQALVVIVCRGVRERVLEIPAVDAKTASHRYGGVVGWQPAGRRSSSGGSAADEPGSRSIRCTGGREGIHES